MSIIDECAKAMFATAMSRIEGKTRSWEEQGVTYQNEWREEAKAVLQCLSTNIDEGALSSAMEAYRVSSHREGRFVVKDAIQAYLNTISKE